MKNNQINRLNLELRVYQLIINAAYAFKPGRWYSFPDLARFTGATRLGIKLRALTDRWPLEEPDNTFPNKRRPKYVPGSFLNEIQKQGGKA